MKHVLLRIRAWKQRSPAWVAMLFMMAMVALSADAVAQATISGNVTDEAGQAMPGVNVLVKNSTSGTTTDGSGRYTISIPDATEQTTLVFSFIGYESQEQQLNGRSSIDVKLSPNVQSLTEVVVVGYGTQKKTDVTGALVRVEEKSLREVPAANLSLALQGRAAGVEIQRVSPRPGGETQIRIRGNRSLPSVQDPNSPFPTNNDPLLVVDGIPYSGNINDLNPGDIVSVDVLKDASATAIYGSRGSNGVIIITTRRGKTGKPQITYDGYYGVNAVVGKYDLYNGQEYAALREISGFGGGLAGLTADEKASLADGTETDWQDVMYDRGFITSHEIGTTGGTEDTKYSLSAGYFKETTALPGQAFTRYSLRGTIDQNIGERIKIGFNTLNTVNITDGENANPMFQLLTMSPLYKAYTATGEINQLPAVGSPDPQTRNPLLLEDKNNWKQQRRRLRTFNSLYAEFKIMEGLRYRVNVGLDYWQDEFGQFFGANTPMRNGGVSQAFAENSDSWSYTVENLLLYDKTIGENHKINFTGLYSVQEEERNNSRTDVNNVAADYLQYYNLGLAGEIANTTGGYSKWALLSYMGRVNYNYADRYLLTITARADGSSRLAEGNKWFYYPAAAVSWNIHNESFMQDITALSNLKVRIGYGRTSNQAISPFQSLGSMNRVPYNFGLLGSYGYQMNSLPNPSLSWEFTTTTNIGLDFGLLTNRISGSVDIYQQKTSDVLQNRNLPATSGVTGTIAQNVGKTESKGIEFTVSTVNLESPNEGGFSWSTDLNFAINREEITQLGGNVQQDIGNGWFVGHPIDVIYDYNKIGIWQTSEADLAKSYGFVPGEIKIEDRNPDGRIDDKDRMIIGSAQPKWQGGLTNRFTFKGFDLSVVAYWRVGGKLISQLYQAQINPPYNSLEGRRNGPDVNYWTPDNPTNEYPKPGISQVPRYGTTLGYFDATFMKIRSVNLGYVLPERWFDKVGIGSFRVYATVQNPFKAFFSDYVKAGGLDPEPTARGGAATAGWGQRLTVQPNTPPTRAFIFGVNIRY